MAIVQPLVLCRDIGETDDATEMVLVGPFSRVRVALAAPGSFQIVLTVDGGGQARHPLIVSLAE